MKTRRNLQFGAILLCLLMSGCVSLETDQRRPQAASTPRANPSPNPTQPARVARTREGLVNTYQTHNEGSFVFTLTLRKNGSATMELPDFETEKTYRYQGHWQLDGDRVTVTTKNGKRTDRIDYVVRDALGPLDPTQEPHCRGTFGLEALSVSGEESRGDYFVWPRQAVLSGQSPCLPKKTDLPTVLHRELDALRQMCQNSGGRITASPDLLSKADVNGDGIDDYIVNENHIQCSKGQDTASVQVFISTDTKQVMPPISQEATAVRVDSRAKPAQLQLQVRGSLCGKKSGTAAAACWRPWIWNGRTQKLQLGPKG